MCVLGAGSGGNNRTKQEKLKTPGTTHWRANSTKSVKGSEKQ